MEKEKPRLLLLTTAPQLPYWLQPPMESSGFPVAWDVCSNTDQLLVALSAQPYSALLIDPSITIESRLSILQEVSASLPVIVIVAETNEDVRGKLYQSGATAVLAEGDSLQLQAWLNICSQYMAQKREGDDQRHYKQSLKLLLETVCKLSLARDVATIQEIVRTAARALNGADGATFVLRDDDCCYYADEDAIQPLWKGQRFPLSACISGWAMLNKKPAAIENIYEDSRIPADAYRPTFVKSLVMVPIRTNDPIGAIGNYWASHHVATTEEIELIQALADSTAIAIENVQLYQQLELRVQQRTGQLEALNRELESFSYSVSHDLRRPLRQIDGLSEALLEDYASELSPPATKLLQTIRDNTRTMKQLIDDLLELARLGSQSLKYETIDVDRQVHEVFEELNAQMGNRTLLKSENLPSVSADANLLRQIWVNLLSNAIKYSSKRDNPQVTVGCDSTDDDHTYYVRDNGVGFDAIHADKLFNIFQRYHSEQEFSGTGIGLSIVHRIVNRHGGRIWAESRPDEGATFYFSLPKNRT